MIFISFNEGQRVLFPASPRCYPDSYSRFAVSMFRVYVVLFSTIRLRRQHCTMRTINMRWSVWNIFVTLYVLTVIKSRARKPSVDGIIIIVRCVFLSLTNLILLFHVCKYWLIKFIFMYIGAFFPLYIHVHVFFNLWYFLIYATGSLCMQYYIKELNITWVLLITVFSLPFSLFINFIKLQH